MGRYTIRRLLVVIPLLWGITLITFFMANLMPGDFVDTLVPPMVQEQLGQTNPEILEQLRKRYGLDEPIYLRYIKWLRELVLHGHLGYSWETGEPVLEEMVGRLPATLQLTIGAMIFSTVAGIGLGVLSAIYQYSWFDQLMTVLSFVWISIPNFVFALAMIYLFALVIPIFPTGGGQTDMGSGRPETLGMYLHHMVLPVFVLGISGVAGRMRYARSSLLDTRCTWISSTRPGPKVWRKGPSICVTLCAMPSYRWSLSLG